MSEHAQHAPPVESPGPKRRDQTQCPKCGAWGCPANRGSYGTSIGRVLYRECQSCEFIFKTLRPHDGSSERVIP